MIEKLGAYVRILLGLVYLISGTNWFFKLITPYPSLSDFIDYMPPPDIVGALIDHGLMFHLAKAIEVITGILLLANRWVPLALVVAMTVTVPVFIVDVFKPEWKLRSFLMGSGSLTMNLALLAAHYPYYKSMLVWRSAPSADPTVEPIPGADGLSAALGTLAGALLPALLALAALLGTIMLAWLIVMIGQYAADPKAFHEIRPMVPRAASLGQAGGPCPPHPSSSGTSTLAPSTGSGSGSAHPIAPRTGQERPNSMSEQAIPPASPAQTAEERLAFADDDCSPLAVVNRFNQLAFFDRKPVEAMKRYLADDFVERYPDFAGDEDGLSDKEAQIAFFEKRGWKEGEANRSTVYQVLADGDRVMVFHHMTQGPGDRGLAFVDIFRVQDGLIVEHWAVGQPVSEKVSERHPMF